MISFSIYPKFKKLSCFPISFREEGVFDIGNSLIYFDLDQETLVETRKGVKSSIASLRIKKSYFRGKLLSIEEIFFENYLIKIKPSIYGIDIILYKNSLEVWNCNVTSFYFKRQNPFFSNDSSKITIGYGKTSGNPKSINLSNEDQNQLHLIKVLSTVTALLVFDYIADCGRHI